MSWLPAMTACPAAGREVPGEPYMDHSASSDSSRAGPVHRLDLFIDEKAAPGNREVLKENILYLFNNTERRYDLAKKAIEFVRENFDIMKVVKEYEEVYEKL